MMMDSVKVGFGGGLTNGQLMVERGKLLEIFWQSFIAKKPVEGNARGSGADGGGRRGVRGTTT